MAETEIMTEVTETAGTVAPETASAENTATETEDANRNDELLKIKADYAKLKAALDNATKEAGNYRKQLRAKQSAEEIAAEEQKAQDEATRKELEELRREVAKAKAVKTVMGRLGTDEEVSGKIAEYLYGAEDIEAALTEMQRAWAAREKSIRLEYGKIPAPGAGNGDGEDEEKMRAIKLAQELGRERASTGKSILDNAALRSYVR